LAAAGPASLNDTAKKCNTGNNIEMHRILKQQNEDAK
jgi:hypothetical protein